MRGVAFLVIANEGYRCNSLEFLKARSSEFSATPFPLWIKRGKGAAEN